MKTDDGGVDILLVEDNPDHAMFALKALTSGDTPHRTHWVKDGEEALDFLHRRRQWADPSTAPRPGLILLDINLPKVDGPAFARYVKTHEDFRSIPIVMLTTSARNDDVAASYDAGANSFVTKPLRFGDLMERIKTLQDYWTATNVLPRP
jgi:CheY-like chemotaxis protein